MGIGTAARGLATRMALSLAVVAATLGIYGFSFGGNNNLFQTAIIHRTWNPDAHAGDPFFDALDGYAAPLYPVLAAILPTGMVLGGVFFILFLACRIVEYWLLEWLLRTHVTRGSPGLSHLFAALFLVLPGTHVATCLGNERVFHSFFSHTELAVPFLILSLKFALDGATRRTYAALGALSLVHLLLGVFVTAIVGLKDLDRRRRGEAPAWRGLAVGILLWLALAAPAVLSAIRASASSIEGVPGGREYADALRTYFPFHFFIDQARGFAPGAWIAGMKAAWVVVLVVTHALLFRQFRPGRLYSWALVALGIWVGIGVLGSSAYPSRFLLRLHPFRADMPVTFLLTLGVLACAGRARGRQGSILLVSVLLSLSGFSYAGLAMLGIGVLAGFDSGGISRQALRLATPVALALAVAGTHTVLALRSFGTVLTASRSHLAAAAAVIGVATLSLLPTRWTHVFRTGLVVFGLTLWVHEYGLDPIRFTIDDLPREKRELYLWIKHETPPDARIVVPPFGFDDLTAYTGRSAVASWKEGASMMWHAGYERVWMERLRRSGLPVKVGRYLGRDAGKVQEAYRRGATNGDLADAWRDHADFVVIPGEPEAGAWTLVRSEGKWRVGRP